MAVGKGGGRVREPGNRSPETGKRDDGNPARHGGSALRSGAAGGKAGWGGGIARAQPQQGLDKPRHNSLLCERVSCRETFHVGNHIAPLELTEGR